MKHPNQPEWVELDEFPDYAVSEEGDIYNMKTGVRRKISMNQHGIPKIALYRRRALFTRSVAVLVAETFCERPSPRHDTPIHLDGDRSNCRASNLMWKPRWQAIRYHRQFFERPFLDSTVPVVEINTGLSFDTIADACMAFGLYHGDIYKSYVEEEPIPMSGEEFRAFE